MKGSLTWRDFRMRRVMQNLAATCACTIWTKGISVQPAAAIATPSGAGESGGGDFTSHGPLWERMGPPTFWRGSGWGWPQISQISLGQAFQPDGLTSKPGQSLTGVVTALLSAAIPARREMAEESRFLVLSIAPVIFS